MANVFVTKFPVDKKNIYAKISWTESETNLFEINIYDEGISWTGIFPNSSVQEYVEEFVEERSEYISNVKNALKNTSGTYTYKFKTDPPDPSFQWIKVVQDGDDIPTEITYGTVQIKKDVNVKLEIELLDSLMNENGSLKMKVEDYKKSNDSLETKLVECKLKLKETVNVVNTLENTLYSKFVNVLNAKKKRIEMLEESLKCVNDSIE